MVLQKIGHVEETILIKGGESNSNSKHFVESSYLLYVLAEVTKFS